MSFADLPYQPPPIHDAARGYGERILDATRRVQETGRCLLDVAYGDDYWQKLDIYLPRQAGPDSALPVLCFLHGGAWRIGYKEWMGFMAPPIVATPAIFVSVSYRLAQAVAFPAPLDDCYDALAWVYRNIRKLGGDPARIHVGGHSAGGHLAALAALRPGGFAARGIPEDFLAACHPMSAPFDLRADGRVGPEQQAVADFLGSSDPADASPIAFVGRKSLPFFISYGSRDMPRIVAESRQMAVALRAAGTPVIEQEYEGLDHFEVSEKCGDAAFPWVQTIRRCLASPWPATA